MTDQVEFLALAKEFSTSYYEDWMKRVQVALKGVDFKALTGQTADYIQIDPLYSRKMGARPIVSQRGAQPWRIIARVDHPVPHEAAEQALQDLENGAVSLNIIFESSITARGFGLKEDALDSALQGVDLQLIQLQLEPANADDALSFAEFCIKRRHSPDQMNIHFGIDPIGAFARAGGEWHSSTDEWYKEPLQHSIETSQVLHSQGFAGSFLRADGRVYHEAGASEAQELAAMLATGVFYLRAASINAGMDLNFARRMLEFTSVADTDQLLSIAKLRALRCLWARIENACGLLAEPINLTVESSWRMLSASDPHTNLVRNTIACFSAVMGGADSICILPFTSAIGLPDAFARRLARNTQNILSEEANLWRVTDPAAGSGGFEALTDALCEKAWAEFQQIEREGGILASLKAGLFQARIGLVAQERANCIANHAMPLIGVTQFTNAQLPDVAVLDITAIPEPVYQQGALMPRRLSEPYEAKQ